MSDTLSDNLVELVHSGSQKVQMAFSTSTFGFIIYPAISTSNPLLLQQIIDKVVNQSNLSALQVLGAALVATALFQGLLTAVSMAAYDTTDRMDLLLGSQVIDKLLRLPLRFLKSFISRRTIPKIE